MKNLFAFAFLWIAISAAQAAGTTPVPIPGLEMKCIAETTPVSWSFCIHSAPESKNEDVIYYFHGRTGNATGWNDQNYYTGGVYAQWRKNNVAPPTVIAISFGPLAFLTERPDDATGGLYRVFMDTVMTRVEKEIPHPIRDRSVIGESMGGMNTLMVGLRAGSPFKRIASLCPPIQDLSPFASPEEIERYFAGTSTTPARRIELMTLGRYLYPTEELWLKNDPLPLSKNYRPPVGVRLYLTCGADDDWGCMKGSHALMANIHENGGEVEWVPMPGGHCDIEVNSLAAFLVLQ